MKDGRTVNMRKKHGRVLALLIIFVAALVIFNLMGTSSGTMDDTETLTDATLPILYFYSGDTRINETHGYTSELDVASIRGNITPVKSDLELPFEVQTYGAEVKEISYSIEKVTDSRLIEETQIDDFTENNNCISLTANLANLLDADTEYLMTVKLNCGGRDVYYYSRIMLKGSADVDGAIEFATMFHDTTFSGSDGSKIVSYIEPAAGAANNDLSDVNINSSLSQIMWADYMPTVESDLSIFVNEINSGYEAISINYIASMNEDGSATKYYTVSEYYRVRVGSDRVYLLDYDRQMEQFFDATGEAYSGTKIMLGIRNNDIAFTSNEEGTAVAFVQNGELWSYKSDGNEIVKVYSYVDDYTDLRDIYGDHDIRILTIDESGTIEFVTYGYVNRGVNEGKVGVGVYRYDSITHTIEQEAFIESDKSYDVLKEEVGNLFYVSANNEFYIIVDNALYKVNMNSQTSEAVLTDLEEGSYVVSSDNRYIAYVESDRTNCATELNIFNLNTGESKVVNATAGCYIRPLYYMEDDLVYGIANDSDIITDAAGNVTFPMYSLKILDDGLSEIKTYEPEGCYVVSVYEKDNALHLNRVKLKKGVYVSTSEDTIISYAEDDTKEATLSTAYTEKGAQTQHVIVLSKEISDVSPRYIAAEKVINELSGTYEFLQGSLPDNLYLVYKRGTTIDSAGSLAEAIKAADENGGIVICTNGSCIWSRTRATSIDLSSEISVPKTAQGESDIAQCIDAILSFESISNNAETYLESGEDVYDVMKQVMSDKKTLNISGATLDEVLYYVSQQTPVIAMDDNGKAVLIVGYDSSSVTVFYPLSDQTKKISLEKGAEIFASGGSLFIGYIK